MEIILIYIDEISSNMVIAFFTALLATVAFKQWAWMKKGIVDTRRIEIAFVFYEGIKATAFKEESGIIFWRFTASWKNFGKTPTKNLRIQINHTSRSSSLPNNFDFPDTDSAIEQASTIVLAPGKSIDSTSLFFHGAQLKEIQERRTRLYVWGWARYEDMFNEPHITKFCVELIGITNRPELYFDLEENPVEFTFTHCHRNNCHDEECITE